MTYLENPRTEIDYTIKAYVISEVRFGIVNYIPVIEVWMNGSFLDKRVSKFEFTNSEDAANVASQWANIHIQQLKENAENVLTQRRLSDTIEEK